MPGEFSDQGAGVALKAVGGLAPWSGATTRTTYLALLTSAPSDTSGVINTTTFSISEYGATGYARQAVTWGTPTLNGVTPEISNSAAINFGPFTAGTSAQITHAALVSALSGTTGELVAHWQLDTARTPAVNDSITIAIGAIKLTCD